MFLFGGIANLTTSITFFSLNGILKQGIVSDEAHIPYPVELINIFNNNFKKILEK
jgi:hypothetical protein